MQYRTGQSDTPVGPLFEGLSVEGSWVESLWDAAPVEGQDSMLTKWRCPAMPVADSKSGDNPDAPVTFVLSTDEVDRHGDVISAEGWRLESYLRNPVLLWAHDYRRPAIGRAVDVWSESRRLMARMEFAPTDFAQEIAALYRSGFQWGVSVGFKPIRFEERRDEKSGAFLGLRFIEQELLEVSAVPVPANRNALRRSEAPSIPKNAPDTDPVAAILNILREGRH